MRKYITLLSFVSYLSSCAALFVPTDKQFDDFFGFISISGRYPILPVTSDGWTDFEEILQKNYNESRVIYVSSSVGSDINGEIYSISDISIDAHGMFQPTTSINAYATISKGYEMLRDGYSDILLLKRGDSWLESFDYDSSIGPWLKSGQSSSARMIITTYGVGNRPILLIGNNSGILTYKADNLIFSGLRIYSHTWNTETPDKGIDINGGGQKNHLYEDCVFERNTSRAHGGFSDIEFRRNIFIEGIPNSLSAKMYVHSGNGISFEGNVFYSPVEENRHFYFDPDEYGGDNDYTLKNVEIRGNTFYTSSRTGLSIRCGGLIDNNLILRNDLLLVGGHGGSEGSIQSATVTNNVFMESVPDSSGDGEWGIWIKNNDGTKIANNIWNDSTGLASYTSAITLGGGIDVAIAKNIDISQNIVYDWIGTNNDNFGLLTNDDFTEVSNVFIRNNDFQMINSESEIIYHHKYADGTKQFEGYTYSNNNYYSEASNKSWFTPGYSLDGWISLSREKGATSFNTDYTDPSRNISSYTDSLGEQLSTEVFMERMVNQSRANWNSDYTAQAVNRYIREGFDRVYNSEDLN